MMENVLVNRQLKGLSRSFLATLSEFSSGLERETWRACNGGQLKATFSIYDSGLPHSPCCPQSLPPSANTTIRRV